MLPLILICQKPASICAYNTSSVCQKSPGNVNSGTVQIERFFRGILPIMEEHR
jgi:hypothetical protein